MKLTINTDVLRKYNLSIGQFLVLLVSYYNIDCQKIHDELVRVGLAERDLFKGFPPVLSDNTKNLIAKIILESDDKVVQSRINFKKLATALQEIYPDGNKAGTTYPWRGDIDEIIQKLQTLVAKYDFTFSNEEAIDATLDYVKSFNEPYTQMKLLRNFIINTRKDEDGRYEIESLFMTIIENNREQDEH